jgi:hypothetical protein
MNTIEEEFRLNVDSRNYKLYLHMYRPVLHSVSNHFQQTCNYDNRNIYEMVGTIGNIFDIHIPFPYYQALSQIVQKDFVTL